MQSSTLNFAQPSSWQRFWWHMQDHVVPHARNHYQPHALHHRTLAAFSVLLLTIKVVSISAVEMFPADQVLASAITTTSVFELTNQSRSTSNLPLLGYSVVLQQAAQLKADDMLARQYFAHNTPDGKTPWTFFDAVGYAYTTAGENLAVHFSDVEPLQDAWMSSPGHRANILNDKFKEMGVGIARGQFEGHDSIFVVEEFGTPLASKAPSATTTSPSPQVAAAAQPAPTPTSTKLFKPNQAFAAVEETAPVTELVTTSSEQEPLAITETSVTTSGENLVVTAHATSNASKLLLVRGEVSNLFTPRGAGVWTAEVPVSAADGANLVVKAFDIAGNEVAATVASFNTTFESRYAAADSVQSTGVVQVFGKKIAVKALEHKAYSAIIAFLLTSLLVAFAVHRHLYHIRLIANTSFVALFATFLLLF